ncbi:MAG: AraC family transcriptional regulator [Gammaproteobacteria bacterium]|nr:AraC family transcriptional regulator [Gammaproteobacteria bacterium]
MTESNSRASSTACLILIDHLYSIGHDAEQWLIDAGLAVDWLNRADSWLPLTLLDDVWRVMLEKTGDELLGFHAGLSINGIQNNVLSLLASNCMTVEQALDKVCEYHGVMSSGPLPKMHKGEQSSTFSVEEVNSSQEINCHLTEAMFSIIITMLRQLTRKPLSPISVQIARSNPRHSRELDAHFQCSVKFDCSSSNMTFSKKALAQAIPRADPKFLMSIEQHAKYLLSQRTKTATWTDKVKQALISGVSQRESTIRDIAPRLCVSTRTLQQKLNKEGMSFQKILDAVRKEIAIDYLKDEDVSMIDLALHLGFSEQSAFNHAFKRWTGCTPTDYINLG